MRRCRQSGMTLIEVMISVTLLSLLMVGMLWAMRIGISSLGKANDKLAANRRVTGAQRVLEQQIAGLMPVGARPVDQPNGVKSLFFQGEPQSMRFVSTYSLQEGSRGMPHILEFQIIPGSEGRGVRLIVNERLYTGSTSAGAFIIGRLPGPDGNGTFLQFLPIETGSQSFVLADKLAACRFLYQALLPQPEYERWSELWTRNRWPDAIRIEMSPLDDDPGKLKMMTITAPVHVTKLPTEEYDEDQ
jgi:general secretion pathway protein J